MDQGAAAVDDRTPTRRVRIPDVLHRSRARRSAPALAIGRPARVLPGAGRHLRPGPHRRGLTALVALGMALVYRANRILNFAQADLGTLPVVLVLMLITAWGWSYFVAVPSACRRRSCSAAMVELAVIRRFFNAPRLLLTVATLGLAQCSRPAAFLLPRWASAARAGRPHRAAVRPPVHGLSGSSSTPTTSSPWSWPRCGSSPWPVPAAHRIGDGHPGQRRQRRPGPSARRPGEAPPDRSWAVAGLLAFTATFLRAGILGLPGHQRPQLRHPAAVAGRADARAASPTSPPSPPARSPSACSSWASAGTASSPLLIDPILALVVVIASSSPGVAVTPEPRTPTRRAGRRPRRCAPSRRSWPACPRCACAGMGRRSAGGRALVLPTSSPSSTPSLKASAGPHLRHPRPVPRGPHRVGGPGLARPDRVLRHRSGGGAARRRSTRAPTSSSPCSCLGRRWPSWRCRRVCPRLRQRGLYLAVTTFAFSWPRPPTS